MNGKKARAVRKFADYVCESESPGTPNREYTTTKNSRPRRGNILGIPYDDQPVVTPPGTISLKPDCRRAVYQRMKASIS